MPLSFKNIKHPLDWLGILVDLSMLALTIFDLIWLMFDALYTMNVVQQLVDPILPFYRAVHENFYFYDGIIISIFIAELLARWVVAIYRKTYDKWFFYPFAHWYDVLGCFPTSSFRILRLLRILGLTYRLHQWGVINLNNYTLFQTMRHYYEIAIEEISDRIVIKVLTGAQAEIKRGQPLTTAISQQIMLPKKHLLAKTISTVIQEGIQAQYPRYRPILEQHITKTVQEVMKDNTDVKQLERIPIVGKSVKDVLNTATSTIVFGVIDQLIQDVSAPEHKKIITLVADSTLEILLQHQALLDSEISQELILETIDLIVQRVRVQQWKTEQPS